MNNSSLLPAFVFGVFGFLYGLMLALLAFLLAGGGHGWGPGMVLVSFLGAFLLPFFGVALAYRRYLAGRLLLSQTILWAFGVDLILVLNRSELEREWSAAPFFLVLWAFLWLSWQVVALGIAIQNVARAWRGEWK